MKVLKNGYIALESRERAKIEKPKTWLVKSYTHSNLRESGRVTIGWLNLNDSYVGKRLRLKVEFVEDD